MEKVIRTVMPPHKSENITLAQAMRTWRKIKAEEERRQKQSPKRPPDASSKDLTL